MKKTVLFLLVILPFYLSIAQTVKGKVVNDIDKPIANVNIYLDGTKTGTVSSADGSFSLNIPPKVSNNLVFKKDEYDSFAVKIAEVINKNLKVVMIKSKEIEEVVLIPFTEATYKRYIGTFLHAFIGHDQKNVKIKNQRSLKFSYDKQNKILKVIAPETLLIENKNLGYIIKYDLEEFVANFEANTTRFFGTCFFEETKTTDKVRTNRMNAFTGSQIHFLRSVYSGKTKDEGFTVNQVTKFPNPKYPTEEEMLRLKDFTKIVTSNSTATIMIPDDIQDITKRKAEEPPYKIAITKMFLQESDYTKKSGEKLFLSFKEILQIKFGKKNYEIKNKSIVTGEVFATQTSYLHSEGNSFQMYPDGNTSNPEELINQGEFTKDKIEKLLPLDYQLGD